MPRILGLKIRNYRILKDIQIGKFINQQKEKELTQLTAFIGKNGVGKSTFFDAIGFLSDALKLGVDEACNLRGGFENIRSQGENGPIEFEIYYKQTSKDRPITYEVSIDVDKNNNPYVKKERLRQRRKDEKHGRPYTFLMLDNGVGNIWSGSKYGILEVEGQSEIVQIEGSDSGQVQIDNKNKLGISVFGQLKNHPRISNFRSFIENWYLSYFTPSTIRKDEFYGSNPHLNESGDNINQVVLYMQSKYKDKYNNILTNIAHKIPEIENISTRRSPDNRLLLCFKYNRFNEPFFSNQISDGTLKIFAYLLLLEDPSPQSLICIEEPENFIYPKLLEILANEFKEHTQKQRGPQIFITTHQPYFIDALNPEEVWIFDKGDDGFAKITRASDIDHIEELVKEGQPLGSLWYSDYFNER